MSWKKHFTHVGKTRTTSQTGMSAVDGVVTSKYSSFLPEIYAGQPQRLQRYIQYDLMDNDSEINASLDTIADFCTQTEEQEDTPFKLNFKGEVSDNEVSILKQMLIKWTFLNDFERRIWEIFRNVIKYGDQIFIRDPETFEWHWVNHSKVQSVIVNEAEGKWPVEYMISDLELNLAAKTATTPSTNISNMSNAAPMVGRGAGVYNVQNTAGAATSATGMGAQSVSSVDASNVVHLSLSTGMDANWPFGNSLLESVFKTYKQKEMLEDAILIYRIQRAPERRIFYIDVGELPPHKAMAYVERVKTEIHQKRIPNRTGGSQSIIDATLDPMGMLDDYFFAVSSTGRSSRVETLPGGESLGDIEDLLYFDNKLKRGLRVPSSYLPTGREDGGATYNDGRTGTAYIQEYRFARFCKRLQMIISPIIDDEFKLFLKKQEINIDSSLFTVGFHDPQSFSRYRQIEIDAAQINVYQPLAGEAHFSKRWLMKRFLNLTEDEILENERMWREENASIAEKTTGVDPAGEATRDVDIGSVGIRPPTGDFDGMFDDDMGGDMDMDDAGDDLGLDIGDETSADET